MKYTVFGEKPKEPVEKEVCLRIEINGKWVMLVACDPCTGERIRCGNLIELTSSGRISRCPEVNSDLGFDLDRDGCIKID